MTTWTYRSNVTGSKGTGADDIHADGDETSITSNSTKNYGSGICIIGSNVTITGNSSRGNDKGNFSIK